MPRAPRRVLCALAALLTGCGASAPLGVPVVEIAPPVAAGPEPPPSPEEAQAEVPFLGTYPRYAIVSWKHGGMVDLNNATGTATLRIERGRVTYAQKYPKAGRERHVTQVYTFNPGAVRPARDAYDIPLVHKSLHGDVPEYSPDSGSPRLELHKRPWGWDAVLLSVDSSDVVGGAAFGAAPPDTSPPDLTAYIVRLGLSPL